MPDDASRPARQLRAPTRRDRTPPAPHDGKWSAARAILESMPLNVEVGDEVTLVNDDTAARSVIRIVAIENTTTRYVLVSGVPLTAAQPTTDETHNRGE